MPTVVLLGTLDTKGQEYEFLRARLSEHGCDVVVVDTGVLGEPMTSPDIERHAVAEAAGTNVTDLANTHDRSTAVATMAVGATVILDRLRERGRLNAVLALGGSGGTHLACTAMREFPLGIPKIMVSTMASGMTQDYVGTSDITMMHSVVDISGINSLSAAILTNAAAAAAGMACAPPPVAMPGRPVIAMSMVGLTTQGVNVLREQLEQRGYEVLVFHATGTGGRTLESLVRQGRIAAVADVTPTEIVDELCGGICTAGPNRLTAAGEAGIAQVVSLGALDMINFGPADTVPARYRSRTQYRHNAQITLVRTNPDECAGIGHAIADRINAAAGPVAVFVPENGLSAISTPGGRFHDPAADLALINALCERLSSRITVHHHDTDINDPDFARAMAAELATLLENQRPKGCS